MNFTHNQDALKLSLDQVEVVLDVTINEARKLLVKARPDDTTTTSSDISRHKLIKSRVPLIVSCLNTSEKATKAMNYLQGKLFFLQTFFLHVSKSQYFFSNCNSNCSKVVTK